MRRQNGNNLYPDIDNFASYIPQVPQPPTHEETQENGDTTAAFYSAANNSEIDIAEIYQKSVEDNNQDSDEEPTVTPKEKTEA